MTKKIISFDIETVIANIQNVFKMHCEVNETNKISETKFLQVAQEIAEAVCITPVTIQDLKKGDCFKYNLEIYRVARKYSNDDRPLLAFKEYDILQDVAMFHNEELVIDKLLFEPLPFEDQIVNPDSI